MRLIAVLCWLVLAGCTTLNTHPTPPARIGLKLAPATLGQSLSLQQHLTIERNHHVNELDTALEINPQQLNLVGLAFGQRVMTLHYDGHTLQTWRHPRLPAQLRGEDVLEDIQLTLWPAKAICNALPAGWRIEEKKLQRTLLLNNEPIMVIDYSHKKPWIGTTILTNLRYHYRLTIKNHL